MLELGLAGHHAGQHVDVRLTAEDGYQAGAVTRSPPHPGEQLTLTVERIDDGEVSPYLVDELGSATSSSCEARSGVTSCGSTSSVARFS